MQNGFNRSFRRGVAVLATAQLYSAKPEIRFCTGSVPARGVSEICDGENHWQWSRLEISLHVLRRLTTLQKDFIIFIVMLVITFSYYSINRDHSVKQRKYQNHIAI